MTAEQLNIKINLDIASLKNNAKQVKQHLAGMTKEVKQSLPMLNKESKEANTSLGKVAEAGDKVKRSIAGIGKEAKDSFSRVTTESKKMLAALNSVGTARASMYAGVANEDVANTTDRTAQAMGELQSSMEAIQGLTFLDLILGNMENFGKLIDNIKKSIGSTTNMLDSFAKEYFKQGDFKAGFKDIRDQLSLFKDDVKEAGQSFSDEFKNMTGVSLKFVKTMALVVASVVALVASVKNALRVSELGEQIYVGAQKAGMSAQKYQEWQYVLERCGIEADELTEVIKTLTEAQIDVINADESMTKAFAQLGMSMQDVKSMGQDELFERTVTALQNVRDTTTRTAIAYKLFGEDAAKLTTVLRLSNEETSQLIGTYNQLGGAMSQELIEKSNRLQGALTNLRTAWQGLKNTLAELVLPAIIAVVEWLTKAIAVVNMFIRAIFNITGTPAKNNGIENSTVAIGGYTGAVEEATKAVEKLKRTTMGFDELNIVGNPNAGGGTSGSGTGGSVDTGYSGLGGFDTSDMIDTDSLGLDKIRDFFEKWKYVIQDIITWGLIGVGVGGAIICALTGNWPGVLKCLAIAGVGLAYGNIEGGTFDRYKKKLEQLNLEIIPIAMVTIGAVGAVIALLMGNIPVAIGLAAMAGIGLSLGGGEGIGKFITKYEHEIKNIVAPSMIGIGGVGAVIALLMGNIPVAIGLAAMAGIGLALGGGTGIGNFIDKYGEDIRNVLVPSMVGIGAVGAVLALMLGNIPAALALAGMAGLGLVLSGSDSMSGFVERYGDQISKVVDTCMLVIGITGAVLCLLTGNIVGAIAMGAIAGLSLANIASGGTFYEDAVSKIKEIWNGLKGWFNTSVKPIFTKQWWATKFDTIRAGASEKLEAAKLAITDRWNSVKNWFGTNVAPKFTKAYWADKFESIRSAASEKLNAAKQAITDRWNSVKNWFSSNVAPKFTKSYWNNKFESIRASANEKVQAAVTAIQGKWNGLKNWFSSNVSPKFTKTYWTNKFGSIKDGAKAAFNGVISVVENAVNGIIRKINTLSWTIPDWVPVFGGDKFGFNFRTISIPRLAEGGIAVSSTLANIGERGKEAVLPLENNTGWMDQLADRIAARNSAPSKIVLMVDGKELGWAAIDNINNITKQTGGLQLVL